MRASVLWKDLETTFSDVKAAFYARLENFTHQIFLAQFT